jgi:beta-glucosidase-like glycosyl hydrolase
VDPEGAYAATGAAEHAVAQHVITNVVSLVAAARVARSVSERASVLLRNDGGALPLASTVGSIAVIGADADTVVQGGGSS